MSLVFSLAEAINLGLGVAGGSAVKPIEARIEDYAFRRRFVLKAKEVIPELSGVSKDALRDLFNDATFLGAVLDPAKRRALEAQPSLDALVDRVLDASSFDSLEEMGEVLSGVLVRLVVEDASPTDRLMLLLLLKLANEADGGQLTHAVNFGSAAGELVPSDTQGPAKARIVVGRIPLRNKNFAGRAPELAKLLEATSVKGMNVTL